MAAGTTEPPVPAPGDPVDDDVAGPARPRSRSALLSALGVGVVVVLLIVVLALRTGGGQRTVSSPLLGQPAPAVAGESLLGEGEPFELAAAEGQFTLVNFFATWCAPCIDEHPELVEFSERHAETGLARVVSVVFQDEPEDVRNFFARAGGDWPVVPDTDGRSVAWGVAAVPETYLVGPEGTVRAKIVGGVTADYLDTLLAQAIGGAQEPRG